MSMDSILTRLRALGYELPPPPTATGNYRLWTVVNGLFMTSGQVGRDGNRVITGVAGANADVPRAQAAARAALLRCLALFVEAENDGARMQSIVSLRGFIACTRDFSEQSTVLNAASDMLVDVFGSEGRHIRSAVGVASLPGSGLVELELSIRCC